MKIFLLMSAVCVALVLPVAAHAKGMSYKPAAHPSGQFDLVNGNRVMVDGDAIYLIAQNGRSFPAPTGPYTTTGGTTFFAEDGVVLRSALPSEERTIERQIMKKAN